MRSLCMPDIPRIKRSVSAEAAIQGDWFSEDVKGMHHPQQTQSRWADLSDELWGSIFSCLKDDLDCQCKEQSSFMEDALDFSHFYHISQYP